MNRKWNTGQALVELTLLLPFLILLTLIVADLARVFYFGLGMSYAVRAGAQYGFRNSADSIGMRNAAVLPARTSVWPRQISRPLRPRQHRTGIGAARVTRQRRRIQLFPQGLAGPISL